MSSAFDGLAKTPNLKLNKPGYDNVADIEALNENADILDAEIQGIKNTFVKSVNGINAGDDGNVDLGIMPISEGGTGASTASQARTNLGIKDIATYDVLPVANGGTGASTVASARNALGLGNTSGAVPIANGGTGADNAEQARKNLDANGFVTNLSVSGRTITYTKKDGTSGTITTQDTTIPSSITSKISVTAGTVAHDGTIPLPSGYSRSQCKYAVWCHNMPDSNAGYGDASSGNSWHRVQVAQNTGKVYCMYQYNGSHQIKGTAGYLCIAVK